MPRNPHSTEWQGELGTGAALGIRFKEQQHLAAPPRSTPQILGTQEVCHSRAGPAQTFPTEPSRAGHGRVQRRPLTSPPHSPHPGRLRSHTQPPECWESALPSHFAASLHPCPKENDQLRHVQDLPMLRTSQLPCTSHLAKQPAGGRAGLEPGALAAFLGVCLVWRVHPAHNPLMLGESSVLSRLLQAVGKASQIMALRSLAAQGLGRRLACRDLVGEDWGQRGPPPLWLWLSELPGPAPAPGHCMLPSSGQTCTPLPASAWQREPHTNLDKKGRPQPPGHAGLAPAAC